MLIIYLVTDQPGSASTCSICWNYTFPGAFFHISLFSALNNSCVRWFSTEVHKLCSKSWHRLISQIQSIRQNIMIINHTQTTPWSVLYNLTAHALLTLLLIHATCPQDAAELLPNIFWFCDFFYTKWYIFVLACWSNSFEKHLFSSISCVSMQWLVQSSKFYQTNGKLIFKVNSRGRLGTSAMIYGVYIL